MRWSRRRVNIVADALERIGQREPRLIYGNGPPPVKAQSGDVYVQTTPTTTIAWIQDGGCWREA